VGVIAVSHGVVVVEERELITKLNQRRSLYADGGPLYIWYSRPLCHPGGCYHSPDEHVSSTKIAT
jgi:hypothetical protein